MANSSLSAAKRAANDEFYTQYKDVSDEMAHYRKHFIGKTIYCNCDDPVSSNFWKYFHNNFASLGLKKLISTHYRADSEPSYMMEYTGGNDFDMSAGKISTIYGDEQYTAGDFRSAASIELLKQANIVCTNPPFSLFRQYIAQLMEYEKKFIIIGNQNAITYKEIFPLLKANKVWLGHNEGGSRKGNSMFFIVPDGYENKYVQEVNGLRLMQTTGKWFTNLDISKRHDGLWHLNGKFDQTKAHCYYEGNEDAYPKYDNYDAINVDKTVMIPIDYPGVMGVPITFMDKYNPEEFEILDARDYGLNDRQRTKNTYLIKDADGAINGHAKYARIVIRNRHPISKADDKGY